ncbi:MAG: ABC transporter permease subunit [Blastocatellia bacterium]|nr:ABC transporter permease subunit [Blastocatellia bacterium]
MNPVLVIALNTFRESVRDKVLYNLLLFVLLLIAASLLVAELSLNQEQIVIARMGLSAMLFFGVLIAIFIGIGLVYKEIDKRTVYTILAKPLCRYEFILGKFFGLSLTLLVNCSVMLVALLAALSVLAYRRYANQAFGYINFGVLPAGLLIYLELLMVVAIALLFSSFSTPVLSTVFSVLFYIIGSLSQDLLVFARSIRLVPAKYLLIGLYYVLPNFSNFNYINIVAHDFHFVSGRKILFATVYALLYICMLLVLTSVVFQKRNFK